MSFTLSWSCIISRSCLLSVSECRSLEGWRHTLEVEVVRPRTDNRGCSPYRTDMACLRRTSAFVFDSGYKLVWREPVCALLVGQLRLNEVPRKGPVHKGPDRTEQLVEAADGMAAPCCGV